MSSRWCVSRKTHLQPTILKCDDFGQVSMLNVVPKRIVIFRVHGLSP